MSQANVEIVREAQPGDGADFVALFRDDDVWAAFATAITTLFHADFECIRPSVPGGKTYRGLDGLRALSLDWLAPWAAYRSEIEEIIDRGDQILVLHNSFGTVEGSRQEVKLSPGNVWSVRHGKIARVEYYADRGDAVRAAEARVVGDLA